MMVDLEERTGFDFLTAVVDSIEAFTARASGQDPRAFDYRRANLRYALERALYVTLANDADAFARFARNVPGERREPLRAAFRRHSSAQYRRLKNRLRPSSQPVLRFSRCASEQPRVLVHVIAEKFVRYLRPILEKLPVPYAYLAAFNDAFPEALERHDVPYVDATALAPSGRPVPRGLRDHLELPAWYDRAHAALSLLRPECVVLVEGNAAQDEVVNRACQALGIPTICVQQGWSPIVHSGFRNMSYTQMAMWGHGLSEILQPYNPDQPFVVTGHPALRMNESSGRAIAFFLQAPGPLISEHGWTEFLSLIEQTAVRLPGHQVIVREHPTRSLSADERAPLVAANVRVSVPAEEPLSAVLSDVGIVASIYSTVLLEALAVGAVPVVVNVTSMPRYSPDLSAFGAGIETRDVGAALTEIVRLATTDQYRENFRHAIHETRRRFFEPVDSPAKHIADLIAVRLSSTPC